MTDLLAQIFASTLNLDPADITDETSPENTARWSSLASLKLAVMIQEAYGIELTTTEIIKMRNVGVVRALLRQKGVYQG